VPFLFRREYNRGAGVVPLIFSTRNQALERRRVVQEEPATTAWFAIQMAPFSFGVFDAFPNEGGGRQAHLTGRVAAALMANASELAKPPTIEKIDVLAAKLPG